MSETPFQIHFSPWLSDDEPDPTTHLTTGLIVFDANAILALYQVDPEARTQLLKILTAIKSRLWLPHQVGLEVARNRIRAAQNRNNDIRSAQTNADKAEGKALAALKEVVDDLVKLRDRGITQRSWDPTAVGLDDESLKSRLDGAMQPVIDELQALKGEGDKSIQNVRQYDPVLDALSPILTGRIGPAYDTATLKEVVFDAIDFRFPNKLPPGHKDQGKETPLERAGDYILWRQTLDHVSKDEQITHVAYVTNETKSDWWEYRPEVDARRIHRYLRQEMRDIGNADLVALSLSGFFTEVSKLTNLAVTEEILEQVERAQSVPEYSEPSQYGDRIDSTFAHLSPIAFENLVGKLLRKLHYLEIASREEAQSIGFDFLVKHRIETDNRIMAIEAKRLIGPLAGSSVQKMLHLMRANEIQMGSIFSATPPTPSAVRIAHEANIALVYGDELRMLVEDHLGPIDEDA